MGNYFDESHQKARQALRDIIAVLDDKGRSKASKLKRIRQLAQDELDGKRPFEDYWESVLGEEWLGRK